MLVDIKSVTKANGEEIESVQHSSEHKLALISPTIYYGYALITTVSGKEYFVPTLDGTDFVLRTNTKQKSQFNSTPP